MSETFIASSLNFAFLGPSLPVLERLAGQAESYLADDPNTCLISRLPEIPESGFFTSGQGRN